jgi:hypothetical protein
VVGNDSSAGQFHVFSDPFLNEGAAPVQHSLMMHFQRQLATMPPCRLRLSGCLGEGRRTVID